MADCNAINDKLEWVKYYPTWAGLNSICEEDDQWYVELRASASRAEAKRTLIAMREKIVEGKDIDMSLLTTARHVRGPYNLTDGEESLDGIGLAVLVEKYDAHELMIEVQEQIEKLFSLSEDEVGKSDASHGGDTASQGGAQTENIPASNAPNEQAGQPVQESTTEQGTSQ